MKKKGFTLIELIIVMALIIILGTTSINTINFYKKTSANIRTKEALYEIREFFSYSRKYCINNKISGDVVISKSNNGYSMNLIESNFKINRKLLVENMVFTEGKYVIPQKTITIKINRFGILESTSIYIIGENNLRYIITIAVGSNKINIKEYCK